MLKNYFNTASNILVYIECNFCIAYSSLGIIRLKSNHLSNLYYTRNTVTSLTVNNTVSFILRELFILISLGYTNKFKLVGVGYRQFYENNIVVYKLRYSHLIYNVLDFAVLTTKKLKKKKFFTVFSLNKNKLNRLFNIWLLYRVPNVYTKKGIIKKGSSLNFKKMMKKIL